MRSTRSWRPPGEGGEIGSLRPRRMLSELSGAASRSRRSCLRFNASASRFRVLALGFLQGRASFFRAAHTE
jgi:hypothetical protein